MRKHIAPHNSLYLISSFSQILQISRQGRRITAHIHNSFRLHLDHGIQYAFLAAFSWWVYDDDVWCKHGTARQELARHDISCKGHAARKLVKADFSEYDYLIAMEQYNLRNIRREFGEELTSQVSLLLDYTDTPGDIDDPWYSGGFDVTYKEIVKGCEGFLKHLGY